MMSFIKDREPAAVAAFVLAFVQGAYAVAGSFGHKLAPGQWEAITALLVLVAGFLVRANVTSNATLAARKAAGVSTMTLVLLAASLLVFLIPAACTPQQAATAVEVADDVWQVAKVLCLADQKQAHASASARDFGGLCQTQQQLVPYLPAAEHPMLAATLASHASPPVGGAP